MKIKIGAIGAADSLQIITEVAEADPRIELVGFEYTSYDELLTIIGKNRYKVDQWIFSGQTPYYYALDHDLITPEEASFPPLHGISFLGTYLHAIEDQGRFLQKLSLDTVCEETLQLVLEEFSIENIAIKLNPYTYYKPHEELIEFHVSHFEKGETEVALTCLLSVYLALKEKGIPCYRLVPSKLAVKTVLNLLVSRANTQAYEKSKVAILGIEVCEQNQGNTFYENHKRRLELELELVELAKRCNGTIVEEKNGRYYIYTTYGDFELLLGNQELVQLIRGIEVSSELRINVGIGSGYTVMEAKNHSNMACEQGKLHQGSQILYVNEQKKLIDYSVGEDSMEYRNLPEFWREVLEENDYASYIPAKIYNYVQLKRIGPFGSELITNLLKNTDRNTRRILTDLEKMGLVEVIGEEASGKRGRPKKIYQIVANRH
ncbi:hypothetical protein [Pseudoneobacillus sp. C159]